MRTFWFTLKTALLVAVVVWLLEQPGDALVNWQGYEIEMPVGVLILGIAAIAIIYASFENLVQILRTTSDKLFGSYRERQLQKGLTALTDGFIAVASGEIEAAKKSARQAGRYLENAPLKNLLSAQAAQLAGKDKDAKHYYQEMLLDKRTTHLGLRGLMHQALRENDETTALDIVEEAYNNKVRTPWLLKAYFNLLAKSEQWDKALTVLEEAQKANAFSSEQTENHFAVLHLVLSQRALRREELKQALRHAEIAYSHDNMFAPVVENYILRLKEGGAMRKARSVLLKTWKKAPHPLLITAAQQLVADKPDSKSLKLFEKMLAKNPDHYLSSLALGNQALALNLWGIAREHLEASLRGRRLQSTYDKLQKLTVQNMPGKPDMMIMSLESEGQSFDPEPVWVCQDSATRFRNWTYISPVTGNFNRLTWVAEPQPLEMRQLENLPQRVELSA